MLSSENLHHDGAGEPRPIAIDLIEEKGKKLHVALIYLVATYSFLYFLINIFFGQNMQALITACVLPSVLITYVLYRKGFYYYSKVWNSLQINTSVLFLCLITGPETFVPTFYIPILVGTLLTFQGSDRKTGYVLAGHSIVLLVFVMLTDVRLFDAAITNPDSMRVERVANMIGVGLITMLEVIYILRISNDIQNKLIAQTAKLDERNTQMVSALYTRDKMMSMLSHDLRSPIASIHAGMELFESGGVDGELQARLYSQMKNRTGQTLDLMDKLLQWSRIQTRSIIYQEETIGIAQIEQFTKSICYLFSNEKLIHFNHDFDVPSGSMVRGDRDMIEAIFRNLISNAIKFTKPGGRVSITARDAGSCWVFSVSDNGKGMTQEEIDKLSEGISFSTSGTDREKGHGLGMQLVHDFIRKHNSSLNIESTLHEGSTFQFELPKL
jgi:signal transduction histidine kinase